MSQLKVYKASAGSGKTFRLAVDYLKLILKDEYAYRHILAVTFTNKATTEMKSRILKELHELSLGKKTAYLKVLKEELQMQEFVITQKATIALKNILHDYSRFSISTIDSFFQRVIKAFNRELGINSAYNVELEESTILEEAVDRLILSVENDKRLYTWLKEFAENKIQEGRGWNLKDDIVQLGKEIYNDSFRTLNEELYLKLNDHRFIADYRNELHKIIHQFENTLKSYGNGGIAIISDNHLSVDDFKGKNKGPANSFKKLGNGDYSFTNTALKAASNVEEWYVKTANEQVKTISERLMEVLQNAVTFYEKNIVAYNTAKLVNDQLYTLGILVDIRKMVKEICHEKGLVLISDSGHFIREIIEGSETPFIYEKTGMIFNHFMIDEFQDTSKLQWENFKPLILNSMSEGNSNLVVGDVKQAIYRWRKGDWNLLAGDLHRSIKNFQAENIVLNQNWRSAGHVIRFNNTIFLKAPDILQKQLENDLPDKSTLEELNVLSIGEIYKDHLQNFAQKELGNNGYFRIKFLEESRTQNEENEKLILNELISEIKKLQLQGVKANEIAILVRHKTEAKLVAERFLSEKNDPQNDLFNFDILSNESLYLIHSKLVNFIVLLLRLSADSENAIILASLNYLYYSHILPALQEQNIFPVFTTDEKNGQKVLNFTGSYEPDLSDQFENIFDDENNFLKYIQGKTFHQLLTGRSLQEMVFGICEQFSLFSIRKQLAYIQAFIEQLASFEKNNASEITSFIEWWSNYGGNITIPVSDTLDAISILTIHKAKGLEFNHVMIPFCNWSLVPKSGDKAPLLWCNPTKKPFNILELVPVKYKKELEKSIFRKEYFLEKYNTFIDNLNLLYVALTRARSGIYIWAQTTGTISTVGDLLKESVIQSENPPNEFNNLLLNLSGLYDESNQLIEYGNFDNPVKFKEDLVINRLIDEFEYSDFRKYLSIKKNTEDFFELGNIQPSAINKGKIIHEILAGIEHRDELKFAINKAVYSGKIPASQAKVYYSEIAKILENKSVYSWFDGTWKIMNEREILRGGGNSRKRPDRIMVKGEEVVVVDYKSGHEMEKHKYQLRSYLDLLTECGYTKIKGYLWYTRNNRLVEL